MLKASTMSSKCEGLVLSGYQKKLKTMKKKYFVLYDETGNGVARLEYYDTERKFKQGLEPKRVIKLKHCFNINRRLDTKHSFVLALSTRDGGFGIVFDTEIEMRKWMQVLMSLQRKSFSASETANPLYEHVWQVSIQKKGIAEEKGITGTYHVCLATKSLTLLSIGPEKTAAGANRTSNVEFLLTTIRRCGDSQCFFYMEVGRQSVIGPGELWMETEDTLTAKNMHKMILSAMSAKSESNINYTSSCQSRVETSEPMRKRSSSANEASKPLNMLQKRQIPIEAKCNNSLQNTSQCYGRDRCDSLPTRNRSSSECSNQILSSSALTFRGNIGSGLRPYTYQRHSNSPPINTPIGCLEGQESSISVDEPEDGSFVNYRFNSRSSEGVIPEENTDEFNLSETKCNICATADDCLHDNYMSMAPVKPSIDFTEINKLKQFRHINSIEDSKHFNPVDMLKCGNTNINCEFPEHISDKLSKHSENDIDQLSDRPTRTYSIGNRVEYNKINKRVGNLYESDQNVTRVRAFSVGSRAKIPRCDLQRGVLFSKTRNEQNLNNSNNNILLSNDHPISEDINRYAPREKKSTSAPILTHKSHNSIDRMSDLMEIDFSKISSQAYKRNHSSSKLHKTTNTNYPSSRQHTVRNDAHSAFPKNEFDETCGSSTDVPKTFTNSIESSGYLEMKPVGRTMSRNSVANFTKSFVNEQNSEIEVKPKTPESLFPQVQTTVLASKADNICFPIPEDKSSSNVPVNEFDEHRRIEYIDEKSNDKNVTPETLNESETAIYSKTEINMENVKTRSLVDNFLKLKVDSVQTKNSLNAGDDFCSNLDNKIIDKKTDYLKRPILIKKNRNAINEEKPLTQSTGDVIINKKNKLLTEQNEAGYKIFQIKSDSSLQTSKKIQNSSHITKQKQEKHSKVNMKDSLNTIRSATPVSLHSSMSPQNISRIKDSNVSTPTSKTSQERISRPPSVTSEHELHYASLDLPQCSSHTNVKIPIKEIALDSSQVPFISQVNSYAKIDFDHSDSSSSSSKACNV